ARARRAEGAGDGGAAHRVLHGRLETGEVQGHVPGRADGGRQGEAEGQGRARGGRGGRRGRGDRSDDGPAPERRGGFEDQAEDALPQARRLSAASLSRMSARRAVFACAVLALVLGGGTPHARSAGLAWQAQRSPFSLRVLSGTRTLSTVGSAQAPLTYTTSAGATHRAVAVASVRRKGATTTYTLATDEPGRRVTVAPAKDVAAIGVDFAASKRDHFVGTGERLRWVDMRGTVVPLKARNQCGSNAPSPFVASSAGLGIWSSSTAVGRIGFPSRADDSNFACDLGSPPCSVGPPVAAVRFCFKAADVAFTVATGSVASIVSQHAHAVGLPRAPWLPELALMKWRDQVSGPADLFDDITQLRSRNLPIGWVILDNPWEAGAFQSGCYGSLRFDPPFSPDSKAMIAAIHAHDVRFMLWISPQLARPGCAAPPYPDGWLTG